MKKCIACDLDGTASHYESGDAKRWREEGRPHFIGRPIIPTIDRIKAALTIGHEVWMFCSRLSPEFGDTTEMAAAIAEWTLEHVGKRLDSTAIKLARFDEIWDDKAVRIAKNQGVVGFTIGTLWYQLGRGLHAQPVQSTIRARSAVIGSEGDER